MSDNELSVSGINSDNDNVASSTRNTNYPEDINEIDDYTDEPFDDIENSDNIDDTLNNSEESDEESLRRSQRAMDRMREAQERSRRMLEESGDSGDSESDSDSGSDNEDTVQDKSAIKFQCQNPTDLYGDDFAAMNDEDIVSIVVPVANSNDFVVECYTKDEIEKLADPDYQVYMWEGNVAVGDPETDGHAITYLPVYKLPFSGIWIDYFSMILLKKFRLLVMEKAQSFAVGSTFGMSQIHGTEELVSRLHPLSRANFAKKRFRVGTFIAYKDDVQNKEDIGWNYLYEAKYRVLSYPVGEFELGILEHVNASDKLNIFIGEIRYDTKNFQFLSTDTNGYGIFINESTNKTKIGLVHAIGTGQRSGIYYDFPYYDSKSATLFSIDINGLTSFFTPTHTVGLDMSTKNVLTTHIEAPAVTATFALSKGWNYLLRKISKKTDTIIYSVEFKTKTSDLKITT